MSKVVNDRLAAARQAFDRHEWSQAYELLRAADVEAPLTPTDLERLAEAARWSRHFPEVLGAFERAQAGFTTAGDRRGAARAALQLAWEHYQRGDEAVATGWYGRATALLEGDTECHEYALVVFLSGFAMLMGGSLEAGRDLLEQSREIARRVGNRDVEALAHIQLGHALVLLGETIEGLAHVDEATAAAMSGELGVQAAGTIYCSTIFLCRNRGDWRRAGEWTEASLRWCERESVSGYPGLCRFHRAEVMRFRGSLDEAERDALDAFDELMAAAPTYAPWALNEVGEIRRRRGDRSGAAAAFQRSAELGFDPQPGLALLRLDDGDLPGARNAIRRALEDEHALARESRALVLPVAVTIEIATGDLDAARRALAGLEARAQESGTKAFAAAAAQARAELALADGRAGDAVRDLRAAVRQWSEVDAPYETAQARVLLGRAYRAEGAATDGEFELETALATFERIGAAGDAGRTRGLLGGTEAGTRAVRTFMFSDIVDSTRFVELLGDEAWEDLLRWHDRTLRACFDEHGGEEIKHEGDGFFVAFENARSAIACACGVQRSLAAHRREHGFAPRVRIGVHSAEATRYASDYSGKGVHTAARVAGAADGDEVLVSRDALEAAGDGFTVGAERALSLKGLAHPVAVAPVDWH